MKNASMIFVGDIYTDKKATINFPMGDIIVYNHEYVVGNESILTPAENTVNLISDTIWAKQIFNNAKQIFANISNNHIMDYGEVGLENTIIELQKENIHPFGEHIADQSHKSYELFDKKISFLGYYMNAFTKEAEIQAVINKLKADIEYAKSISELIFVTFHFGNEHYPYASEEQQRVAHAAIDFGAEMVIGHHPHCIQNVEKYKSKLIFYSLGNFYFPSFIRNAFWKNGKSQAKFVWRNAFWTNKGLAVSYDIKNGNVDAYMVCCNRGGN